MSWEDKSCLKGQKESLHNFDNVAKTPQFWWFSPLFFKKKAGWEWLRIASHVDFSVPVHPLRSDCKHNFDEAYSENQSGVPSYKTWKCILLIN